MDGKCNFKCSIIRMLKKINIYLLYKRVCPTKNEPQQKGISFLEREREMGEREG
jgi:hypothetical protein